MKYAIMLAIILCATSAYARETFSIWEHVNIDQLYQEYKEADLPIEYVVAYGSRTEIAFTRMLTDTERLTFNTVRLDHKPRSNFKKKKSLEERLEALENK